MLDVEARRCDLGKQLLRSPDRLLQLLQRRVRQAGKITRLVDQHLCFVLQRRDLVGHLLQRPCGRQHVLRIVAGIEHGHLRRNGHAHACDDGGGCD